MRFDRSNLRLSASSKLGAAARVSILGAALAVCALASLLPNSARAATSANAQSPLGMNLNAMNYYNPEQPFLNIFKTSGITRSTPNGWFTRDASMNETNEEAYLQLDSSGFPTSLKASSADANQRFTQVCTLLMNALGQSNGGTGLRYRSGQYDAIYTGQGTMTYGSDASLVSRSTGQDVFNVASPSANGVWLCITSTDPNGTGNYLRNIQVVKAEEASLLAAGNVFEPSFLSLMSNFRLLRAMQWLNTDLSPTPPGVWANRPQVTDAGWGSGNGVPYEVILQLCNAISADCWINIPHTANNAYISSLATLAHGILGTSQKVYVEFSNEVWNGIYPQYQYAVSQGQATWPSANTTAYEYNRNWYGMRVAQTCDLWKAAWGADAARVVCVMGAQGGSSYSATDALNCPLWTGSGNGPCSAHGIGAVAVSDYFGFFQPQSSWYSQSDGGLAATFSALTAALPALNSGNAAFVAALAPFNLPLVAYEGGQTLIGSGTQAENLFIAANRDPRMAGVYAQALSGWKASGAQMFVVFNDIYMPGPYGEWGALESFLDTVSPLSSAPPKWQALQNFISSTPCWWTGCSGSTTSSPPPAAVPMPPSNLAVH
jgi:hypothetical protein